MIEEARRPPMRPEVMRQKLGGRADDQDGVHHETFEGLVSKTPFQKSPLGSDLGKED